MNLRKNQKGFTIVELLIVVVVIAILAAISIVAYTGITNRANKSAALEAANSVRSVAVAYNGANGGYPATKALFVSGGADAIAKLPSDIVFKNSLPVAADDAEVVAVQKRGSATAPTGFRIHYWDYAPATGSPAVAFIDVGEGALEVTAATMYVQ